MKVLVTGATGFVGAHVVKALGAAGVEPVLAAAPAEAAYTEGLERQQTIYCDITSADGISRLAALRADACIHCAWYATPGRYLQSPKNIDFMLATVGLARELAAAGCRRFVGVGTCFEYDTSFGYLSESTRLEPAHPYSAAKVATFLALRELGVLTGMSVTWARLFYMYGPGEHPDRLVASVIRALLEKQPVDVTPGEQVRDFMHVEDVGRAIAEISLGDLIGPVNVASGRPITVRAVVEEIAKAVGAPELVRWGARPYSPTDPMFVCADATRLRRFGFTPHWTFADGIRDTVAWWRAKLAK